MPSGEKAILQVVGTEQEMFHKYGATAHNITARMYIGAPAGRLWLRGGAAYKGLGGEGPASLLGSSPPTSSKPPIALGHLKIYTNFGIASHSFLKLFFLMRRRNSCMDWMPNCRPRRTGRSISIKSSVHGCLCPMLGNSAISIFG